MTSAGQILAERPDGLSLSENRLLLSLVLRVRPERLIMYPETELSAQEEALYRSYLKRRLAGEPYPYIAGRQAFYGRDFAVRPGVLIPRPDTELIVELALRRLSGTSGAHVLDLGTGSGCIAVTVALEAPGSRVWAADLSETALETARENLHGSGVRLFQSRWFDSVPQEALPFDLILSNPPYVADDSPYLKDLSHEPLSALASGRDGLDDLREIIRFAPRYLKKGGTLMVEHGFDQGEACRKLFSEAGFSSVETEKDLGENDRVTSGIFCG